MQAWYQGSPWLSLLKPLSAVFRRQARKRRAAYLNGRKQSWQAPVPVVVVGNITVGGVGKSPLVARLAEILKEKGYKPGIVSRGYASQAPDYPYLVEVDSNPVASGDEPLMLARATLCPVVIDANRVAAAQYLLKNCDCDLILSDDGMQHYALARDIEVAVVDGKRGLGNALCLPAGPLREPPDRLSTVDFVVFNGACEALEMPGYSMNLIPYELRNLVTEEVLPVDALVEHHQVHAVAGIGNPDRFFETLTSLGYNIQKSAFPDHYAFKTSDFIYNDALPVIMTEKDAVKCRSIAHKQCWYLAVRAELSDDFQDKLVEAIGLVDKNR